MKGAWKKVLFLFILGLPVIGFLVVKHLSDVNLSMPGHYVVESVNPDRGGSAPDTLYHRMRDFNLVNQLGQHVTRKNLEGRVTVVDFFHTRGRKITPRLSAVLEKIQDTYAQSASGLHILSITTDPGYDDITALKNYAERYHARHDLWWFVRGTLPEVTGMAGKDFQVTLKGVDSTNALSSPLMILLDKHQYVRGYYDVRDSAAVLRLVHDMSLLMLEKEKAVE
ncbi:MAG TPA: SCO family protein [Chitinophagaceae bacterium]|jgi:protein SCO1/2|nr:SCO family protein [Chitinophagaceae bacterium]